MRERKKIEKPLLTSPKGRNKKRVGSLLERYPELDSESHVINTKIFGEMEENIEYRISNNEYRSEDLEALKSLCLFVNLKRGLRFERNPRCAGNNIAPTDSRFQVRPGMTVFTGVGLSKSNILPDLKSPAPDTKNTRNGSLEGINLKRGLRFERNPRCASLSTIILKYKNSFPFLHSPFGGTGRGLLIYLN